MPIPLFITRWHKVVLYSLADIEGDANKACLTPFSFTIKVLSLSYLLVRYETISDCPENKTLPSLVVSTSNTYFFPKLNFNFLSFATWDCGKYILTTEKKEKASGICFFHYSYISICFLSHQNNYLLSFKVRLREGHTFHCHTLLTGAFTANCCKKASLSLTT